MRWSTNDMLVIVATTYRNAVAHGTSPVDAVADRLGITYTAAKKRIARARRAGKLPPVDSSGPVWSHQSGPPLRPGTGGSRDASTSGSLAGSREGDRHGGP